jgi:hypothetical protein
MKATEFYQRLERHDWYSDFSDDWRLRQRVAARMEELRQIAADNPVLQNLLDDYQRHKFQMLPKPTCPEDT